uniref:Beta-glucosidase-like SFR2, chloroplastic n=1 Tax=Chenopodium quinoa TaxID=63459 RepID=A0A803MNC0_CHEQI
MKSPAHVEDKLNDAWLQFAEEKLCDETESAQQPADALLASGAGDGGSQPALPTEAKDRPKKKKSYKLEIYIREERLRFWSDPDTELKLAKNTGVTVFRMGVDWTRIMPKEPTGELNEAVNFAALERYKWIINRVRSYGMKVMLTLFHHSLPPWAGEYGGWKLEKTVDYFMHFTRLVVDSVSDVVDYWVTFNEPHVFCMLTYCAGAWPGGNPDMLEVATSALPSGVFNQTMDWIAIAHSKAYDYIHENSKLSKPLVGVAHHVSFMRPYGLFDVAAVTLANSMTLYPFMDSISEKMDYIGLNYYGQFHERYKHLNIPFIITENGVSDETDIIRRPYILEHLLAIYGAMIMGIPIIGYLFWTISDNWEWADGYGPKFGLVAVDRANNLARVPRPSYHLFSKVATTGIVSRQDREKAWRELRRAAKGKKTRPFYRAMDKHGLMGLDEPVWRPYADRDWRFGHYEMEGLQDPLSRFLRFICRPLKLRRKSELEDDDVELALLPLGSTA